ncbi:MAG: pyridoxine 5'-phosphate synthase [Planctomycetota bacterium]|nr:MAG: pyridoxine 5'-phosphate synthase [Planctomycetota bacterium]
MIRLGVNIDHVATVRQARRTTEPDPVRAAVLAELGGADGITVHLREDRRHIQDRDVRLLRQTVTTSLNLEMALWDDVIEVAAEVRPDQVTLVPEKREEVTTEGGLDVVSKEAEIAAFVKRFRPLGVRVSLFVDPEPDQVKAAAASGAECVEFHTGAYSNASGEAAHAELDKLIEAAFLALDEGLRVFAGHGLTYVNIEPVLAMPGLEEVNIGHSIISRAVFVGLERAVREMKDLLLLNE